MASTIVVNFYDNVVFNDGLPTIAVAQGQFVLSSEWYLNIDGGLLSGGVVSISPSRLTLGCTNQPVSVEGSVMIPLQGNGQGQPPTVTVSGFSGEAFVAWPQPNGGQGQQNLQSGVAVTLTGYTG